MRYLVLFVLIGAAIAVPRHSSRIIGGELTTVEEYPFMANMQYALAGVYWYQTCGGSLITSKTVLSAAHCYYLEAPSSWRVRLGSSLASSGGTVYDVNQLILHENFNVETFANDIAVVVLSTTVVFSPAVNVARIPGINYAIDDFARVSAIGWGEYWYDGAVSEELRGATHHILNQGLCVERYGELKLLPGYEHWPDVTESMLCSGILNTGSHSTCRGDYGGPIVYQGDIIVGIASWLFQCGHIYYPSVNTRVSYYSNWIVEKATL